MSHYDESQEVYEERDRLEKRFSKASSKIRSKPLSAYTVGEFLEIFEVFRPAYNLHTMNSKDVDVLERLATR